MAKHAMPESRHAAPPRPKNRRARRAVAITLAVLLTLGAAGGGGYYYLQNRAGKPVDVYPAQQLGSSNSWYGRVQTGGQIRADRMQAVYLSSTQTVTEIYVQEGQQVQVGDPILAFDTTLDEVELTRKQIAIDQLNLDLEEAQDTLEEINTYRVGSPGGGSMSTPAPTAVPPAMDVPTFQGGAGTEEDPYVFLWADGLPLNDRTVEHLLTMAAPTPTPDPGAVPDGSPVPDSTSVPAEDPAIAEDVVPVSAGEPSPVGANQGLRLSRLLAPILRDAATGDPAPSDGTGGGVPGGTDPGSPGGSEFDALEPEAIMDRFRIMEANREDLAAYYNDVLSWTDKDVILSKLNDEQRIELWTILTNAGVDDPFPTPVSNTPQPPAQQTLPEPSSEPVPEAPSSSPATASEPTDAPVTDVPVTEEPTPSPEPTVPPSGATYFMVFETRANNSLQGDILRCFEVAVILSQEDYDSFWSYIVMDPSYVPHIEQEPGTDDDGYYFDSSIYHPAEEIERMRAETQREIAAKTIDLKMAQQDLKQVQYELSNGQVLATTAGVVKSVLDPDEALQNNEPVVKISGGGGYFITPSMSEFDMQRLHVGDTVTVDNYMSGETLEGTITEISQFPTTERYPNYYADGTNNNVSKYPFTVAVSEDANLRDGYYANVYFSASSAQEQDADAYYLENAFIRTEAGKNYVYAAGADGLLEKRYVTTGKSLYGNATEITGGLDPETDYIAFPYGRSVKAGAATVKQEDIMVLYNGY